MRRTALGMAAVLVLGGSGCDPEATGGAPAQLTYVATMTGAAVRPSAVAGTGSGLAEMAIREAQPALDLSVTVIGVSDITQVHIHVGGATDVGPIAMNLLATAPPAGPFSGVLTGGTKTPSDVVGGETFASLVAKIKSGEAYIDIHTTAYPDGAIRGQLHVQ